MESEILGEILGEVLSGRGSSGILSADHVAAAVDGKRHSIEDPGPSEVPGDPNYIGNYRADGHGGYVRIDADADSGIDR